jgi:putative colanic acid biosynthesis UDP-glucose lipid carrier transferase
MRDFVRAIFAIGDVILLNLSIALAIFVAGSGIQSSSNIHLFIFSNLTWLFLVSVARPYSFSRNWDTPETLKNQLIFILTHLLVVASLIFFYGKNYAMSQVLFIYVIFAPAFFLWKLFAVYARRVLSDPRDYIKNVLIVGPKALEKDIQKFFTTNSNWRYHFVGLIDLNARHQRMEEVHKFCETHQVDEILIHHTESGALYLKELIDFALNDMVTIKLMTDIRPKMGNSEDVSHFNQTPFVDIAAISLDDRRNQIYKRAFDLFFTTGILIFVLSWLVPFLALLIKLDSKGPVFFIQKRNGRKNKPFMCLKFRTMVVNNEADSKQATANDSRITRVGRFLRKSSLDEFPQFFNVLKGDMSLIGPRPHPIKLNSDFAPKIRKLRSRHYVKPGITGLAQAMGYRGETGQLSDMKNRVTLDRFYIENWSFALDLKIIYMTVVSLLRGSEKAY